MPHQHQQQPVASSSRGAPPPVPTGGRGIKGFFSRTKTMSPEPVELPQSRSRLRSFINDTARVGNSSKSPLPTQGKSAARLVLSKDGTARAGQRTLSSEVTIGRQRLEREVGKDGKVRPTTPTERTQRQIRFNPTALPAMQKGDDGKWQPPSLSRGSMSTSALATLAQDEEDDRIARKGGEEKVRKGHKHTLSNLFQSTTRHKASAAPAPIRRQPTDDSKTIKATPQNHKPSPAGSNETWQQVSPPDTPSRQSAIRPNLANTTVQTSSPSPLRSSVEPRRPTHTVPLPPTPSSPPPLKQSNSDPVRPTIASPVNPARGSSPGSMPPPPIPIHARHDSSPTSILSRDHYLLRLSTTFLVKSLTPIIKGPAFVQNDKNVEMRRIADDRLTALARMEKAWGADWVRAANILASTPSSATISESPAIGSTEAKVRLVYVGERAKERERKGWIEAVKDGILLCFLLNHLFPAQPSHIPRLNVTEDGILRATNLTRFITACQTVGLPDAEIFGLADLQEGSEVSIGRVAQTVVALARLAGPGAAGVSRAKSPSSSRPGSRSNSRPPSRTATSTSPPTSPRRASVDLSSPTKRLSTDKIIASPKASPNGINMDRSGSNESQNELHAKLVIATDKNAGSSVDDPSSFKTPTTSTFALPPTSSEPPAIRRTPLSRASTQPNVSPIRPKSPTSSPSSRSITPVTRSGNLQIRPSLQPRNTTGSRVSVSFADHEPWSPRSENGPQSPVSLISHPRERTPSLISAGSRVTSSAYSRSSAAYSVATVLGGDHANAIDLTDDIDDGAMTHQLRERRASEKKLQEARQKIIGTLLSSEDLPADLRREVSDSPESIGRATEEARNTALSDSLAALEGHKVIVNLPTRMETSPGRRPLARRGMSIEVGRPDINRVVEEEEVSSNGTSVATSNDGSRPSALKRLSSNGKVYVPKRSASPASNLASPVGTAFPVSPSMLNPSYMLRTTSLNSYQPAVGVEPTRVTDKAERRQSDGYPHGKMHQHGRDISVPTEESSRPLQIRINSMVNLPVSGMERSLSLFRENSSQSAVRVSQSLQVLEFREPDCPTVKYQLGNCIGRGQFGSVYRSLNLSSGQMVAIKRIRLHGMREDEVTDVMKEVELLKRLSHPSIVKYEGMSRDEEYLNIVLEFVENGSLGQTLKSFGNFNERLVSSYVAKILEGLDYLHSQGVVHCDLKAANILSTKNGNVKLSDFGVSLNMKAVENIKQDALTAGKEGGKKRVSEVAGTPNWMAPEVISLAGASFASDIWSLGCTVIELLTGKPPYSEITNSMTVLFRIVEDEMPPLPEGISHALTDFLKLCFIKDPNARPPAVMLFEHPWVKGLNPELQALRPQDSVPFLRRVSMDLRRVDSQRLFDNGNLSPSLDGAMDGRDHRHSMASSHGRDGSGSDKSHVLIKTSFGKAIPCRVCLVDVKKSGVLCQDCGLIAHTSCASKASPRCDIHEQLALFTRQQEILQSLSPPRIASPQPSFEHREGTPLTALPAKFLNGIIRSKSRGGLASAGTSSPSQLDLSGDARRKPGLYGNWNISRPSLDQPSSSRSTSFNLQNRSSLYSNMTEYDNDLNEAKRRSGVHFELGDDSHPPTAIPGGMPVELTAENLALVGQMNHLLNHDRGHVRGRESKSDCCVQ
ncbi:hypothetical protein I302_104160 [Kwoniella bestiolae CBS 10118]|uniref:STE/STE11/CDC15 protein kinase n=1 Tax=Kwoniella bestiolae CBS 10118 TaxID=1296100 RepID=A0A1B9GAH3_9TREE|nr:STE/STE11/CDC15 protein kinase [Kwoniella bestiolae CBS 10118]OCF28016.1 STE/STE11/CDC15 protein kinase [Kwoniella bestiolae CBS 10118]